VRAGDGNTERTEATEKGFNTEFTENTEFRHNELTGWAAAGGPDMDRMGT